MAESSTSAPEMEFEQLEEMLANWSAFQNRLYQVLGDVADRLGDLQSLAECGLLHVVAYAIVVLFREANAAVPEVATAQVSTLRQRLWKVGAVVCVGVRRLTFHVSARWSGRELWGRVQAAVRSFVSQFSAGEVVLRPGGGTLPR